MKRLFFIIILITLPIYSKNIWEETFITSGYPKKIEILDSNNIFIANMGWSVSRIYKSTNQGKNWSKIFEERITGIESLEDMSVVDNENIYLSFFKGQLLRSIDGGVTFEHIILDSSFKGTRYISMYNKNIGTGGYYITKDGWKNFELLDLYLFNVTNSYFINDSILYSIIYENRIKPSVNFLKLNTNTQEYNYYLIDSVFCNITDMCIINDNLIFACGKSNTTSGGSGHDAIYKSTDSGKNWRRVLDLYSEAYKFPNYLPPFGLQQIAFKDSFTGIAVGQFGKILYTYDGGESWIYERELHKSIVKNNPPTMLVRYAGSIPIIADYLGYFYRMVEDNLAPGPSDTLSISGRVWLDGRGHSGVSVFLNDYRVTMTDSMGYYRFTQLKKGSYKVQAKNKYIDNPQYTYFYRPFEYSPLQYDIELSHDTTGFDFNATDLRTYHTISGYVVDTYGKGLADVVVRFGRETTTADGLGLADTTTTTDSTGKFEFTGIESYKHWDITPVNDNFKFSPLKHTVRLITGDTTELKFTGIPTTSVWERGKDRGIRIKPNPTSDFITIQIQTSEVLKTSEVYKVQIFDMLGLEVLSVGIGLDLSSNGLDLSTQRIDVSHLPAGVYIIRIGNKVEKFVKI